MVIGYVMGTLRGVFAWSLGYVVVTLLLLGGLLDGTSFLGTAADNYLNAHTLPGITGSFEWLSLLPISIIGLVGFRLGNSVGRGVFGRTKAFIMGGGDSRSYRFKKAGKQVAIFGVGYLLTTLIAARVVGVGTQNALIDTAVLLVVVGIPTTGFGVVLSD